MCVEYKLGNEMWNVDNRKYNKHEIEVVHIPNIWKYGLYSKYLSIHVLLRSVHINRSEMKFHDTKIVRRELWISKRYAVYCIN